MTDGQRWRQPTQYLSQGYGPQYPQDEPWRPGQYDPHAHQQRISGRPYVPQVPPAWEEPGYGPPPSPPPPSPPPARRRGRSRWPVYVGLGVLLFVAVAGITYVLTPRSRTAAALTARPETCAQRYAAWKTGPAGARADMMIADVRKAESAASAGGTSAMDADLQAAGKYSAALRAYPVPACADPSGYWPRILTDVSAGAMAPLKGAMAPLKKVQPLEAKLDAELKRTTAH